MERNETNLAFCRRQITRMEGTNFFAGLSDPAIRELVEALLVNAESQAAAETMVSSRLFMSDTRPTPADFARMAMGAKREQQAQQTWQPPPKNVSRCSKCFGSGMEIVFYLHTREGHGEFSFVKKTPITKEVFESFSGGKLDPLTQAAFSGAKPCHCGLRP